MKAGPRNCWSAAVSAAHVVTIQDGDSYLNFWVTNL